MMGYQKGFVVAGGLWLEIGEERVVVNVFFRKLRQVR